MDTWKKKNGLLELAATVQSNPTQVGILGWMKLTSLDSLLNSAGFAHEQSFAEVAASLLTDLLGQLSRELQTLLLADSCQDTAHLANIGKWV